MTGYRSSNLDPVGADVSGEFGDQDNVSLDTDTGGTNRGLGVKNSKIANGIANGILRIRSGREARPMTTVGASVARRWKRDEAITLDAKHRDATCL